VEVPQDLRLQDLNCIARALTNAEKGELNDGFAGAGRQDNLCSRARRVLAGRV